MSNPALQAQIDAAEAYESLFVPALFEQWVPTVAGAAQIQPGQRVLDVGCGTGVLARAVAERAGPGGTVAGLDPNPGMLAVAQARAPMVDWRQGTAESIPFPDQAFDAVLCQFSLMFFVDRHQALREMLRVLAPAGQLVITVWDLIDNIPGYAHELALVQRLAGPAAAAAVRAPFVLGDRQQLASLFEEAGVHAMETTTIQGTARFPSIRVMVEAELRGWLPVMGVHLTEQQITDILQESEEALAAYVTSDGQMTFDLSAHLVTTQKE